MRPIFHFQDLEWLEKRLWVYFLTMLNFDLFIHFLWKMSLILESMGFNSSSHAFGEILYLESSLSKSLCCYIQ